MTEKILFDMDHHRKKFAHIRKVELMSIIDFAKEVGIAPMTLVKLEDFKEPHEFSLEIKRRIRDYVKNWEANNKELNGQ